MFSEDSVLSLDIIGNLCDLTGINDASLRLLFSVFAGYPLALIYRKHISDKSETHQHLFFILSTLVLTYWSYGVNVFHPILAIVITYLILLELGGSTLSVALIFAYNLSYLLVAYYFTSTENYDVTWTTPQCILVLRLTGLAFDVYDGRQPLETLSSENRKTAMEKHPSILEIFGYALFPAGFFIGPQFPMRRYLDLVAGKFKEGANTGDCVRAASLRFGLGLIYTFLFEALGLVVADALMYSEEFAGLNVLMKFLFLGLWGRFFLYKYIACWLFTDGACILFGVAYNGKDEKGALLWDGVENVNLSILENANELSCYIQSFNISTNRWVAKYIYKRLKFLGNQHISRLVTLMFLAVWHGFHSGYYLGFFFEFLMLWVERDVKSNAVLSEFFAKPPLRLVLNVWLRVYSFIFVGWCLLPIGLLTFDRYWRAYASLYHVGTILFFMWPFLRFSLKSDRHLSVD